MTKKQHLLAKLENKQLDVEIKQDLLDKIKSATETIQANDERVRELQKVLEYQDGLIGDHRVKIGRLETDLRQRQATVNQLLANEREFMLSFSERVSRRFRVFLVKIRNWFRPVQKQTFTSTRNLTKKGQNTPYFLSPEILAMSADEYKKKYIDTVAL